MTYKDVAEYLKVSLNQVHKYVKDPDNPLPRIVLSRGTVRFRKDQVDAWLAGVFMDPNKEFDSRGGEVSG